VLFNETPNPSIEEMLKKLRLSVTAQSKVKAMSLLSDGDIGNPYARRATSRFPSPVSDCHSHWGNQTFNN
jgi:hypothetical protein